MTAKQSTIVPFGRRAEAVDSDLALRGRSLPTLVTEKARRLMT